MKPVPFKPVVRIYIYFVIGSDANDNYYHWPVDAEQFVYYTQTGFL